MRNTTVSLLTAIIFCSFTLSAQVPVREEPRHKNVLENKYIRILDVWLQPGDTSLFHIHSTPSVFLVFTTTNTISQIKGAGWEKGQNVAGYSWYRSFFQDTLVHRVGNIDTVPFHVTDVELLSAYKPSANLLPLPFEVLYQNEKVFAYKLTNSSFNNQTISKRGPMIAELVAGNEITFHDALNKESTKIKTGKYLYIKPGSSFYFSANGKEEINLVLFEIK